MISTKKWCDKDFVYNPGFDRNITLNKNFTSISDDEEPIQFKPQVIDIKARPGVTVKFNMSYKSAEDFPLDVYFLMDISDTMLSVKKKIHKEARGVRTELMKLTNNVRFGIGSFVEKPGYPYVDIHRKDVKAISYSFKNNLPLTNDIAQFENVMIHTPYGANYDDPEAGFDALMQVMTCEPEIKWRNNSRRIIVFFTDSTYHSMGDGKMIGIIKPNDMQCHYVDGIHETALSLDYPSVSQINYIALEKKFKIIFVAPAAVKNVYEALEKQILESKYEELKENSTTVDIIVRAYRELMANVALDPKNWPSFVDLKLDQDCNSNAKVNCKSTPLQPVVQIPAELKVISCPKEKLHKLVIGPRTALDTLTINLEIDCECECEKKINEISPKCNSAGSLQCGVCKCNKGSYGDFCGCNGTSTDKDFIKCRANQNDTIDCSGNGVCRCGICECVDSSGEFCQYDDKACPALNGLVCADHGICRMGKCQCRSPWSKDDCSCDTSNTDCIAPYSNEVCSGHGTCECGKCTCDKIKKDKDERYTGTYCDSCEDCGEKRCKDLEDYVYCFYMNLTCDDKYLNQTSKIDISMANRTEFETQTPEWRGAMKCKMLLDTQETIVFMHRTDDTSRKLHILVQKEIIPPNKINMIIAICSAAAIVVLIGLLTLIVWKVLIDLHDAREFRKFSKEAQNAGYDVRENILYEPAITNFSNPVYNAQ